MIISKLVDKDIYDLLAYKGVANAFSISKKLYKLFIIVSLLLTLLLNVLGVYYKKVPDFNSLKALAPYFK